MTSTWKSDSVSPPDGDAWDLLVIGGGTAGLVGAQTAAGFGASVLLVERDRLGGDCLWTGCVPSKALLAAAHAAADARRASAYGVRISDVEVDFAAVLASVRGAVAGIEPDDSPETVRAAGVRVARGTAVFTGPDAVTVDGAPVRFRRALLATGAPPEVPDVPGLTEALPRTSETIWDLTEQPARLLVLGGGSIGCELAQAFARLGSAVTLVEAASRLLPGEDADASVVLRAALGADGVTVLTGTTLRAVRREAPGWSAELSDATTSGFDVVLVATGRQARTGRLGLDRAGIELDADGTVRVDPHLRTTHQGVWAAGDLTGHPAFTHVAGVHGALAATNAVLGLRRSVDTVAVPRITYTQPEVASVGALTSSRVRTVQHTALDRARAEQRTDGFTRLVLDRRGRVIGATIIGPRAGESLAEVVLAVRQGLRARDLAGAIHAYPTYGDGVWKATIADVQRGLRRRPVAAVILLLAALRRRRS